MCESLEEGSEAEEVGEEHCDEDGERKKGTRTVCQLLLLLRFKGCQDVSGEFRKWKREACTLPTNVPILSAVFTFTTNQD